MGRHFQIWPLSITIFTGDFWSFAVYVLKGTLYAMVSTGWCRTGLWVEKAYRKYGGRIGINNKAIELSWGPYGSE